MFRGRPCIPDIVWQDLDDLLPGEVELVLYERVDAHLAKVAESQLVPRRQVILFRIPAIHTGAKRPEQWLIMLESY